jgi:hypothetical protein
MNQEHQPQHINTFSKGADYDTDKELLFSQQGTGIYVDSRNARINSSDGNQGSIEKKKGEELLYQNATSLLGYKCICAESVNEDIIEFWAPTNPLFPGIVRVNGVIVLNSLNFQISPNFPLQWDKNQACIGGEIMITDNNQPPFIFNIKDMVDSFVSDPQKYFNNFDPLLYQINLQSPLDIPVFIELVNVGGGGGLPVGQYQYQMRYASASGDRTQWSPYTPMIPIVESLSSDSLQYPWVKTYGGPPAPSSKTAFAPRLRFRVTNLYNYDYIEIKRTAYNSGAGIEFTPNGRIVARIDIQNQEISVRDYIDPSESNVDIALSEQDETQELVNVERAKAIRYFDKRVVLMNVKVSSKEADLIFETINGKESFPVIDKIDKAGYNDPWNHTHRKSYMRGEKYSFGINLYDGVGTKGFVTKIDSLKDYQFPNRRDVIASETSDYSYGGTVKAADTTTNAVSQTHEVFDLVNSQAKSNNCDFKNIVHDGKVLGLTGTKSKTSVKDDCDETDEEIENHGANVGLTNVSVSYQPFTPVRENDPDTTGHNYVVNTKVGKKDNPVPAIKPPLSGDQFNYRPAGFAPNYYAMGLMLSGVDNFPKWAKAFSVVRTDSAKRVLCQGLGYYDLIKGKFKAIGSSSLGGKETNKFRFFSPDIENGIVSSETVNDIIDNPQNYELQFVSPLGFFSEWYSAEDNFLAGNRDRCIDMITYARIISEHESDPNLQINPSEDVNMGISGGDGYNYVTFDKYRNLTQNPNTFGGNADKGNRLLSIAQVKRVAEGRGTYLELETNDNIYGAGFTGGSSDSNFEDAGLKDWTEPLYIINIVRKGAEVPDLSVQKYKQTGHYQKLESIIGRSNGQVGQKFQLVDERWEDAIPAPTATSFGASTDRYIYIKDTNGIVQKWINVTYKTGSQIATIVADIASLGAYNGDVTGIYTHNDITGAGRFFEIVFNNASFIPSTDSLILVIYDKTAPIRIYGGDTYIGESIFSPIDGQANAKDNSAETQFALGIGLPFREFKINPRYYTIRKAGALLNVIQDTEWFSLGFVRQLCAMFTVESKAACHLAFNNDSPNEFFPLKNYVIRPNRWDEDKSITENGIWQDYEDDYGSGEKDIWKWGGFRFLQQINPDYSTEPRKEFFSKPEFGFEDKTEFCTRIMWSLPRAINVQNAPGLKTFPSNNSFDIDDDQGEIKRAWDATSGKGENLYAFTNTGICLLVTNKSILSDINSGELAYMAADSFVKQQYWINKDIGMFDEFWRSAAEAYIPLTMQDGSEIRREAIFFANNESVFRFMDNDVIDIGRIGYHSKVYKEGIKSVLPSYQTDVTAIFNKYYKEYWLQIRNGESAELYVFNQKENRWQGTNDHRFDMYSVRHNQIFGHRNLETFELEKGYIINGANIQFEVLTGASSEQFYDKEFIRTRINTLQGQKPTRVEFYKEVGGPVQCALDASILAQGALYMKDYRGYEGFIPRIDSSVNINRPRFQQRLIIYKIIHNLATDFKIVDSSIQYKILK